MTPDFRDAMARGDEARRSGDVELALASYRRALAIAPDEPHANSLCGLSLLQLGRLDEAEPLLRKAVQRAPREIAFRLNLAALLEAQRKLPQAVILLETVVAAAPGFSPAAERLADLCLQADRPMDAFNHLSRAFAADPGSKRLAIKTAGLAIDLKQYAHARRILERAVRIAPGDVDFLKLFAKLCEAQSDWRTMAATAARWTEAQPNEADAWDALATSSYEVGNLGGAMKAYGHVLDLIGRDAARLAVYAQYCVNAQDFDAASGALAEAEALDPKQPDTLSIKALVLTYQGRFDEAAAYCRRCISVDPAHVQAYKTLSNLTRGGLSDGEFEALKALAGREDAPVERRIAAALAYADCCDARDRIDEAFAAYSKAKRIGFERAHVEGLGYDAGGREKQVDRLISMFQSIETHGDRGAEPRPIFIIGMPRSGTTLIESVLGAHSRVRACGERVAMPHILSVYLATNAPTANDMDTWARSYWNGVALSAGEDHITDKNPFNFDSVGLIAQLFPRAKFVHLRRNPVEVGLSVFRNEFAKFVTFANRLEDIGRYYGQYARLLAHWEQLVGERMVTIQYEHFVNDFANAAAALVRACGLEWEPACLQRDTSARAISTLSSVQVRQTVTAHNRSERYRAHLQPLINALTAARIDLATGAITS